MAFDYAENNIINEVEYIMRTENLVVRSLKYREVTYYEDLEDPPSFHYEDWPI